MINEETYDEIERYLDDVMTPSEKTAFEFQMYENPDLLKQVNMLRTTRDFLQYEALVKEKTAIRKGEQLYFNTILIRRISLIAIILIAAAVLLWLVPSDHKNTATGGDSTEPENQKSIVTKKKITTSQSSDGTISYTQSTLDTVIGNNVVPYQQKTNPDLVVTSPVEKVYATPDKENRQAPTLIDSVWHCGYILQPVGITEASCSDKNTGSITLTAVHAVKNDYQSGLGYYSAKPPYQYAFENGKPGAKNMFSFLKAGIYTIEVRDANGCSGKADLVIEEKECVQEVNGIISYAQNTAWEIPAGERTGMLMVYNAGGGLVAEVKVEDQATWNGYDNQSQRLKAGAYYYRFISDNKIIAQGSITILE